MRYDSAVICLTQKMFYSVSVPEVSCVSTQISLTGSAPVFLFCSKSNVGKFRLEKFRLLVSIMMKNNSFSGFRAAAGEIFELLRLVVLFSLCFYMISSVFPLRLNVGNFEIFPH